MMKLFRKDDMDIVRYCQSKFNFELPSALVRRRFKRNTGMRSVEQSLSHASNSKILNDSQLIRRESS